jgi:signal transduction histidine kinase
VRTSGKRGSRLPRLRAACVTALLIAAAPLTAQQLVRDAEAAREAALPGSSERLQASLHEVTTLLRFDLRLALQRAAECIRLAEQRGDHSALAVAHSLRARAAVQTLGPQAARDALATARDALRADAPAAARAQVHLAAAIVHFALDEPSECVAELRRAFDLADESGDGEARIRAHMLALTVIGDPEEAVEETRKLHELALGEGHAGLIFSTGLFQTMAAEQTGVLTDADEKYARLLDEATRLGDRATEAFLALRRAIHHAPSDGELAMQLVDRAIAAGEALGDREQAAVSHEFHARMLMSIDRADESRAAIGKALELLDGSGMLLRQQSALTTAAYLASLRGDGDEARRHGDQVAELDAEIRKRSTSEQRARMWQEMGKLETDLRKELELHRQSAAEYEAKFDRAMIIASVALLAVLGIAGALLWRNQRRLRRTNAELQQAMAASQELQQEREALAQNLQQIERLESIGLLAGGFAHDFNNILVAVRGNSQLLLGDETGAERRQMLEEILQASDRAAGLCKDILSYAHATPTPKQPTDLREVLRGIVPLAKAGFGSGIEVTLDLGEASQFSCVDRVQIEQVLLNVLVNAGDAVGDRGHIHVSIDRQRLDGRPPTGHWFGEFTGEPRDCVAVAVLDNGQGMDAETIRRIFDPFFSTRFAGRGLGLAAAFGILRRHDGIVEVQSEVGRGTQFTIYLPAHDEQAADAAAEPAPDAVLQPQPPRRQPDKQSQETILVVDDERDVCTIATRLFEGQGHAVLSAHGGLEALELVECYNDRISLALLDVTMPDMDGQTLARHLRSKLPGLPIVLMTGHAESAVRGDDLDVPLVLKPFDLTRLTAVVRDELATRA